MRIPRSLVSISLCFFWASTLSAGTIDRELQEKISAGQPAERFSVLIQMADQVDTKSLQAAFKAQSASYGQRHKQMIESLKSVAQTSQRDILVYLEKAKMEGRISDYKNFWIANLIWIEAPQTEIETIAGRPDVTTLFFSPKMELVQPVGFKPTIPKAQAAAGIASGVERINAPALWALGYRGKGRLICLIDTGVNRLHAALTGKWRGTYLAPSQSKEAWYDPVYGTTSPTDPNGHGTFVAGITVGRSAAGDSIGVAPEALYIAARAIGAANWPVEIASLQWASDPDDDPNTLDDVPDVINNSWGIPTKNPGSCTPTFAPPCWNLYWQVIDNVVAAGPAVVFAAGNEGPCPSSMRSPGERPTTTFNVFSVGSTDTLAGHTISSFSSRGPSACDNITIKPEVVAPGEDIVSAVATGGYGTGDGTSFSSPHVAGAVALLKDVNPNASSNEILQALYVSAQDLGTPGEDNDYGHGFINLLAAKDSLPPLNAPRVFVSDIEIFSGDLDDSIEAGESIELSPTLINDGLDADSVKLTLSTVSALVSVTDSTEYFGFIGQDDTAASQLDLTGFDLSPSAQNGEKLPFNLKVTAAGGYLVNYPLLFYVKARPKQVKATHDKGNSLFTISNFGQYGFATGSINSGIGADSGKGFRYPKAGVNHLFEGAVLFGMFGGQVSDGARDATTILPDSDFTVAPGGETVFDTTSPNRRSDQDGLAIFTDEKAENPLGIKIVQRSFVFSDTTQDDYVILEYTIKNESGSTLNGLRAGFFTDFDFSGAAADLANFNRSLDLGYMNQSNGINPPTNFRGLVVTDTLGVTSFRALENATTIYDDFTDDEKWQFLSEGFMDTANTIAGDGSIFIASGPWNIASGDSARTSFAIVGGTTLANIQAFAARARTKYRTQIMCTYRPGDMNNDGRLLLSDVILLVNHLFKGAAAPNPFCSGDPTGNGTISVADVIYLVYHKFKFGPAPVAASICCKP